MPSVDLYFNQTKVEWVMTLLCFLQTIVNISISIKPTNFILGTSIQQHWAHLKVKLQVTLTDAEGEGQRSQK